MILSYRAGQIVRLMLRDALAHGKPLRHAHFFWWMHFAFCNKNKQLKKLFLTEGRILSLISAYLQYHVNNGFIRTSKITYFWVKQNYMF